LRFLFDQIEIGDCLREECCPISGGVANFPEPGDFASAIAPLKQRLEIVGLVSHRHFEKVIGPLAFESDRLNLSARRRECGAA